MCFGEYKRDNSIRLLIQHEMCLQASELYPLAELSSKDYTTPNRIVPEDALKSQSGVSLLCISLSRGRLL